MSFRLKSLHSEFTTTGRFPVTSRQGSNYMLLFYCKDTSYTHVAPFASRSKSEYLRAFRLGVQFFQSRGFKPLIQRLDNEVSIDLLDMLRREFDIKAELAPPSNHRSLLAERGIQTWKNHFIATQCSTDRNFPLLCWEDLVETLETYLNLMRAASCDPSKSHVRTLQHEQTPADSTGHACAYSQRC